MMQLQKRPMLKTFCLISAVGCTLAMTVPAQAAHLAPAQFVSPQPLLAEGLVDVNWPTIWWVLGLFIILLIILQRTAWKNVLAGLNTREERIRKDISDAEDARVKAQAALKDYTDRIASAEEQVRDMLSAATIDAEKIATSIKMAAQKEGEDAKNRATREIDAARDHALTEIYAQTAVLATNVAEKILRRNLNPDDQQDLVRQGLEQMPSLSQN